MSSSKLLPPRFSWLMEQLSRIEGVSSMPRAKARLYARDWGNDQSVDVWESLIEGVFEARGVQASGWGDAPRPECLPMLVVLPCLGPFLLRAGTAEDGWLVDGPLGRQRLRHFPRGARFIPIKLQARAEEPVTARHLMWQVFMADRQWLVFSVMATVLGNLLALGVSFYSMQVYDRVIPTQGTSTLIVLTVAAVLAVMVELLLKLARSSIVHSSLNSMDVQLAHKLYGRLMKIRLDQLPQNSATLSGQLRGYETIRSFVSTMSLYLMADAPFAFIFLIGIYWVGGAQLAAVVVAFFIVSVATGMLFRRRIEAAAGSGINVGNRKQGLLLESVVGAETIKGGGVAWQFLNKWNSVSQEAVEHDGQVRKLGECASYLGGSFQQVAYICLIGVGAYIAGDSGLTTGALVACSILSGRVLTPIGMLPGLLVQGGHAKAALQGLEGVFSLQRDNHGVTVPIAPESISGEINLRDVSFAYGPEFPAVKFSSLSIKPGERVAILGPVGSGKSTLLKIIAGLYKPQSGQVFIDGLDVHHINRENLCGEVGYLSQHVSLFSGTLRDNLLLGAPDVNDASLLKMAKVTGVIEMISRHPQGLDLPISEGGGGLSGGQRQLVALTRLMLMQPKLWLLDEPTASMDSGSEERCLSALKAAMRSNHTAVIVTHKPALLKLVNRVIVVTAQGVVLDGPRDEVLMRLGASAKAKPKAAALHRLKPVA